MLALLTLVGVVVGISAYHAGYDNGLAASAHVTQIVREGPRFGFFLFPLFSFFLIFVVIRGLFFGRHWGGHGGWGPGGGEHGWKGGRRAMIEDWHKRQHEQASGDHPGAGGEPTGT